MNQGIVRLEVGETKNDEGRTVQKQESYLQIQMGTISGSIHDFDKKGASAEISQSPDFIGARGEN